MPPPLLVRACGCRPTGRPTYSGANPEGVVGGGHTLVGGHSDFGSISSIC